MWFFEFNCHFYAPICAVNDQNFSNFETHLAVDWARDHVSRRLMVIHKRLTIVYTEEKNREAILEVLKIARHVNNQNQEERNK